MPGHDLNAQQFGGIHHVLPLRPQSGAAALPRIATVEQQRAGPRRFKLLDQCGHVCKAADFAVLPCSSLKIKKGKGMRLGRARFNLRGFKQLRSHPVRPLPAHAAHTQINRRLAKITGQQLRMAIGHVQQVHIASFRKVIQIAGSLRAGLPHWKASGQRSRHHA